MLSTTTLEELDRWIDVYFDRPKGFGFDLDLGLYVERGLPNAYDLFTRAHLTDLLANGYRGRNVGRLRTFLETGLRRSLAIQLSDGSVASGYRSTGQTWVLGAQITLFHAIRPNSAWANGRGAGSRARVAAWRAFRSLTLSGSGGRVGSSPRCRVSWQPTLRVGYEAYTADGHYSPSRWPFWPARSLDRDSGSSRLPAMRGSGRKDRRWSTLRPRRPIAGGRSSRSDLGGGPGPGRRGLRRHGRGRSHLRCRPTAPARVVDQLAELSGGDWLVPGLAVRTGSGASPLTLRSAAVSTSGRPTSTAGLVRPRAVPLGAFGGPFGSTRVRTRWPACHYEYERSRSPTDGVDSRRGSPHTECMASAPCWCPIHTTSGSGSRRRAATETRHGVRLDSGTGVGGGPGRRIGSSGDRRRAVGLCESPWAMWTGADRPA